MSVPVELDELPGRIATHGDLAYLVTVDVERSAHVVSVRVRWDGDQLAMTVGRRTLANVDTQPAVTLLWPPDPAGEHSLIVDGEGAAAGGGDGDGGFVVRPASAVLHRLARAT